MPTAKEEALAALARLPDDATYEDMQYRLHVLEKIRFGEESLDRDGGMTTDEVRASLSKWLA